MFSLTLCPPDIWDGSLFKSSSSFNICISSLAFFIAWFSVMPEFSPKILMLSRIDRSGIRDTSCGVKPILFLLKSFGLPKILILP